MRLSPAARVQVPMSLVFAGVSYFHRKDVCLIHFDGLQPYHRIEMISCSMGIKGLFCPNISLLNYSILKFYKHLKILFIIRYLVWHYIGRFNIMIFMMKLISNTLKRWSLTEGSYLP